MRLFKQFRTRAIQSFVVFGLLQLCACEVLAKEPLVVFLVRHAEKAAEGRDPELTSAGKTRAKELANVLRDAKLAHVHSTDFVRTRDTAGPVAARFDLDVELYNPANLPAFVRTLRKNGGRHLIVGHSNTTPAAVAMFGGEPGDPIREPDEFDRLYIVTVNDVGKTTTVLMRYGTTDKAKGSSR